VTGTTLSDTYVQDGQATFRLAMTLIALQFFNIMYNTTLAHYALFLCLPNNVFNSPPAGCVARNTAVVNAGRDKAVDVC